MLTKTNLEGEYFDQEISMDPYLITSNIFDTSAKILDTIERQPKYNMDILNIFLKDTKGESLCPYLNNLNNLSYDEKFISYSKEDISDSFLYVCNSYEFFKLIYFLYYRNLKCQ